MRARFLAAVRRSGEVRKLNLDLKDTKITTAASMRELWGAVWQGNAATLEELKIKDYEVSERSPHRHCMCTITTPPMTRHQPYTLTLTLFNPM